MGLNTLIIAARKAKNWTQKDLANALKVNVKNVSRWELGSSAPSFEAVILLAKVLEVSLDYLAGTEVNSSNNELVAIFNAKADLLSKQQTQALKTILLAF